MVYELRLIFFLLDNAACHATLLLVALVIIVFSIWWLLFLGLCFVHLRELDTDLAKVLEEILQFLRKNEWLTITQEASFDLSVTKEMSEVDMEELASVLLQHEVSRVSITDSEYVRGYTLASERLHEVVVVGVELLVDFAVVRSLDELATALLHEEMHDALLVEGTSISELLVHVGDAFSWGHEFDVTDLEARFKYIVADHLQISARRLPDAVHNLVELQDQVVLA
jgi:hypothetical protein